MKISHRGIPKYQAGKNLWYKKLIDYDPNTYKYGYDTTKLVDGDMGDKVFDPWVSNIKGFDTSHRYQPTTGHGGFGVGENHFNYTLGVEGQNYYKKFGQDILDSNGNFTPLGEAWAKAVDALLPKGSEASFYDKDGKLRTFWNTKYRDAHSRDPKSFSNLRDYVNYVRNDQILGARHNVFLNRGKRYFYKDENGKEHWVDPSVIGDYTVTKNPVRSEWNPEHTVYWEDYELTGPEDNSEEYYAGSLPQVEATAKVPERKPLYTGLNLPDKIEFPGNKTPVGHHQFGIDWSKVGEGFRKIFNNPDIYSLGRLALNIAANDKIYGEQLKGIKPVLKDTYLTHRQVVGDEATKQAYYRRAAQGQTSAAKPFTSDADRQMAYQYDAKRIGDELRAQGDSADNQMIQKTSDESNQHQWSNTQRATEVANYNTASINQADSLKHNLRAQWYAADASSVDNALKEIQYKMMKKQAEEQALNDQIFTLQQQQELLTNPKILAARKKYQSVLDKHKLGDNSYDWDNDEVIKASREYQAAQIQLAIENKEKWREYKNKGVFFVKNGYKITQKVKDNMLYMSTKDVVKHFREMTKLASDAQNRKQPKIERLTSHPKGDTRRYQQGGVAPFLVYTPITLGGETTTSLENSTSSTKASSKDSSEKDSLDFIKELFKELAGKGLQIDINTVYSQFSNMFQRAKAFGEDISTGDIQLMYLSAISKVNEIQRSKDIYDKAKAYATENDALNEYAVTSNGLYVVQDKDGKISATTNDWEEAKKQGNPITNSQLLHLREYSPQLLLQNGNSIVDEVVNSGMGVNKIGEAIKSLAGKLDSTTSKIEGLTEMQSKKVKAGLQIIAQTDGTPDGIYKITNENKDSKAQVQAALEYIYRMLSPSQVSVLNAHGGAQPLILSFLSSQTGTTVNQSIQPLTGKAAKESQDSSLDKIASNPLIALQREIGGTPIRYSVVTRDSNTRISVNGTSYSSLPKVKSDMSIDEMLNTSEIGGIVTNKYGITFGDQQIDPSNLKDIMYSNVGGVVVTLPCKIVNGVKQVNLDIKDAYERAEQKALQVSQNRQSKEFIEALGKELKEEHLDSLLDSRGLPNKNMFQQFLVVEGYTTDRIPLKKDSQYIEKVKNPTSDLETRISQALSTDSKKSNYSIDIDNHWGFLEGGWDDVYRGTVFIPITNNTNAAISSWGSNSNISQSTELEELFQISTKSANFNNDNSFEQ